MKEVWTLQLKTNTGVLFSPWNSSQKVTFLSEWWEILLAELPVPFQLCGSLLRDTSGANSHGTTHCEKFQGKQEANVHLWLEAGGLCLQWVRICERGRA